MSTPRKLELKDNKGALIGDVVPDSPADKAGFKPGDIVTEFNGRPVEGSRQLKLAVARVKPGEKASTKILRDGSTKTLNVTMREVPGAEKVAKADSKPDDSEALKGVAVTDLDSRIRQQFNIPSSVKGAVVRDVEEGSAAAEAGLKPGDVILEINRQRVALSLGLSVSLMASSAFATRWRLISRITSPISTAASVSNSTSPPASKVPWCVTSKKAPPPPKPA